MLNLVTSVLYWMPKFSIYSVTGTINIQLVFSKILIPSTQYPALGDLYSALFDSSIRAPRI